MNTMFKSFDHWIVFGLLVWVAVRMIRSAQSDDEHIVQQDPSRGMMLVVLSIATSLDALAIGLSLALLRISIWYPSVVIGVVTGATSFIGILLGQRFSKKFGKRAVRDRRRVAYSYWHQNPFSSLFFSLNAVVY